MSDSAFAPSRDALPATLPIFPLARAVLLPGRTLPLNIFEPRYLNMVLDALGAGRMIGMVQPRPHASEAEPAPVYAVGCAGRITVFQETEDGRLLIQLTGVCRFDIDAELEPVRGYRRVRASWSRFARDLAPPPEPALGFRHMESALRRYVAANELSVRWEALEQMAPAALADFLASQLPFDVEVAQALVEAPTVVERAETLLAVLELAAPDPAPPSARRH